MNVNEIKRNVQQVAQQPNLQIKNKLPSFSEVLSKIDENKEIHFSKHAEQRLALRDINFTSEQLNRIESGITKAKEKGIKDSLVLVDDVALLVNVKNKLVITAVDKQNDSVFTNIDGAVIV